LYALKAIHQNSYGSSKELPDIYKDQAYANININRLSTSTLGADIFNGGGFCPVVADGYGIGYKIMPNELGFSASTYHQYRNGSDMTSAIDSAIQAIAKIIQNA